MLFLRNFRKSIESFHNEMSLKQYKSMKIFIFSKIFLKFKFFMLNLLINIFYVDLII
jgi:hypothetical protein